MEQHEIEESKRFHKRRIITDYIARHVEITDEMPTLEYVARLFKCPMSDIEEIYNATVEAAKSAETN